MVSEISQMTNKKSISPVRLGPPMFEAQLGLANKLI